MKGMAIALMIVMLLPGCVSEPSDGTPGCTDESASNWDIDATTDDGSCEYSPATGIISGKVVLAADPTVENTSADDNVTSALVSAVLATGSDNITMDKIYYYFNCVRNGTSIRVEDVHLTGDAELEAGDNFEFIAELSECAAGVWLDDDGNSDPEREEEKYFELVLGIDGGGISTANLGIEGSSPQKGDPLT
jgi:hypothetical protein